MTHSIDLQYPSGTGKSCRSQKSLPYSRLNSPYSDSLSLQKCCSPCIIFMASPGLAPAAPCPPYAGNCRCSPALGAAQDTFVSLGWGCSWLGRAELLLRAALDPLIQSSQPPKPFLSYLDLSAKIKHHNKAREYNKSVNKSRGESSTFSL